MADARTYEQGVVDGQRSMMRGLARGGIAVSAKMLKAAQASYWENANPSYGLTDADMRRAIKAALRELGGRK